MKNSSLALDGAQRRGYSNGGFFSRFKSASRVEADIRTVGKQLYQCRRHVKFRLTSRWPSVCFFRITEDQLGFTPDMKKIFIPSMLIAFAMICSCQKQDSAAEPQLAQRKAELDARQNALDEREKELALRETVLNERERALPEKGKATANARTIPDAAQLKAERDKRIQQPRPPEVQGAQMDPPQMDPAQMRVEKERKMKELPPEVQSLIPNASQVQGQRDGAMQQLLDQRQRRQEELQGMRAGSAGSPAATFTNPSAASPAAAATSPTPSPTVEATSPTP